MDSDFTLGQTNNENIQEENFPDSSVASEASTSTDNQEMIAEDTDVPSVEKDNIFWGKNIIELPKADSFRNALEILRLPEIECGKPYECVIKLFTCNNSFGQKIELTSDPTIDNVDFVVKTNSEKNAVYIKGTPRQEGELKLCIHYAVKNSRLSDSDMKGNSFEKKLTISPDPVVAFFDKNVCFQEKEKDLFPNGVAGEQLNGNLDISQLLSFFDNTIILDKCDIINGETKKIEPEITASINKDNGNLLISGVPQTSGPLSLLFHYSLNTFCGVIEKTREFIFTTVAPDPHIEKMEAFIATIQKIIPKRGIAGNEIKCEFSLPDSFDPSCMEIADIILSDSALTAKMDIEKGLFEIVGTPVNPGTIKLSFNLRVKTKSKGDITKSVESSICELLPDPKTLWKNLPTDPNSPYQSPDEEHAIIKAGDKTIVAASKRGRSHAHDGKFRDDNFKVDYIEKTGWFIIAVSDGAGSAKYSREGSRIACHTFWEIMHEKLASDTVNNKINNMEPEERDNALKNAVLSAAYQGLSRIDAEAKKMAETVSGVTRKDYSATFLGYVMKHFGNSWLIISIGIGDGVIGMMDRSDKLTLLSEPDGGEFVGQTRFVTMNEVWLDNPISRTRAVSVEDFGIVMSMSDGVSDPKFETDNNLKKQELWQSLWNDIAENVPLEERSENTSLKLCEWLDFWAKGNHDDRTIVLVY